MGVDVDMEEGVSEDHRRLSMGVDASALSSVEDSEVEVDGQRVEVAAASPGASDVATWPLLSGGEETSGDAKLGDGVKDRVDSGRWEG